MKLDKELVREILLQVEAATPDPKGWVAVEFGDREAEEVDYHVELLVEAGYLRAQGVGGDQGGTCWLVERLTYSGHEFLDTVRDGEVWRRTKDGAAKVGGAGLKLVAQLAGAYAKQVAAERLGLHLP